MAGEVSLAFTMYSIERGRLGAGGAFPWLGHNTSVQINDLGTAVWIADGNGRLCRFVYVLAAATFAAKQTATQLGADPWAAADDQFKIVLGGNTTTGGAGLIRICGTVPTTLSSGRYGWCQTHGPAFSDNVGPTIDGGSAAVVAGETHFNAPAKANAGKCSVHLETHTCPPFATCIKSESSATPEMVLYATVF